MDGRRELSEVRLHDAGRALRQQRMQIMIDHPTLDRAVREVLVSEFPLSFRWLRIDPHSRTYFMNSVARLVVHEGRAVQRYHALMAEKRHASRQTVP
jgi:hypothetical protein